MRPPPPPPARAERHSTGTVQVTRAECQNVKEKAPNSMAESHTNQRTCTTEEWSFSWSLEMTDMYRSRT
uniref:Uncharacterized protein n=1 Tax=Oryza barthii TaxID=65489 RepID=A0A0D3FG60_9ORYZ